jgi:phosphatidylglycerophosphate synthase
VNDKFRRLWATKNKDDEWWSSFVTSPLAIGLNFLVVDWEWLSPNRITLLSFIVALMAVAFIVDGGTVNFLAAAILIQISHILDCMDGQMARYRGVSSKAGSFIDKITDQLQVVLWFGAVGYASYVQTGDNLPVFLAFAGVAFYALRGYVKYVTIYTVMCGDATYLQRSHEDVCEGKSGQRVVAGLGCGQSDLVHEGAKKDLFVQRRGVRFYVVRFLGAGGFNADVMGFRP